LIDDIDMFKEFFDDGITKASTLNKKENIDFVNLFDEIKFIFKAVNAEDKKKNWIFLLRFESKSFIYGDEYELETKTL
jgi:hypothetical protein